jgi:predicted amidohydrolase
MRRVRIGCCYEQSVLHNPGSRSRLQSLDVLVFPELVDGGYAALAQGAAFHRASDSYLAGFRDASRSFSLTCIAGSVACAHSVRALANTCFVFASGRQVARYNKIHLFKPAGDHRYFVRGNSIATFRLHGMRSVLAGVAICYDLRFPELIRKLRLKGIGILFVPARWPSARDDAWRTLLKARAIENQIFVVGCNALGREGGYSYAFDPLGKEVFTTRTRPRSLMHTFSLDLRRLRHAKKLHDNLRDAVLLGKNSI